MPDDERAVFAQAGPAPCSHPEAAQTLLYSAADYITGDRFLVRRCDLCGLVRTSPFPPDTERYYPAEYYGAARRYPAPLERLLSVLYTRRARRITALVGGAGRALDIGCGRGWLLAALRRQGWQVAGTEMSETAATYARDVLHLNVLVGDLAHIGFAAESFDLIVLWHVLEHVPDPQRLLDEVARVLHPDGMLLAAVPNFGSLEARVGRDGWFHLDVPRHLNHFTVPVLRKMLGHAGLTVTTEEYVALEYDSFSAVQTALNHLGIRRNLLYNLLRTRGARMLSRQADRRDIGLTAILAPVLAALSLVWTPVAARLHTGATVTVFARKEGSER